MNIEKPVKVVLNDAVIVFDNARIVYRRKEGL